MNCSFSVNTASVNSDMSSTSKNWANREAHKKPIRTCLSETLTYILVTLLDKWSRSSMGGLRHRLYISTMGNNIGNQSIF